jgi:predicted membrane-bound spermidine synthase
MQVFPGTILLGIQRQFTGEKSFMTTNTLQQDENAQKQLSSATKTHSRGTLLIILVFIAGAVSLAIEMAASRLLAPYFGTSLFVWADIIGLILLYLAAGYSIGGRVADRYPTLTVLYSLTIAASLLTCLIPMVSNPLLSWLQSVTAGLVPQEFYGSLIAILLLFSLPTILLGCVSPFAIRLHIEQPGSSGRSAGLLYAISTAGSIVGTFLPVLVIMPWLGTANTFLLSGLLLLLCSLVGLALHKFMTN